MAKDLIKIKGGAAGFQIMVDSSASLEEVQAELDKRLAEHPEFFPEGTKFQLVAADLQKEVKKGLGEFLKSRGLAVGQFPSPRPQRKPREAVENSQIQGQVNHGNGQGISYGQAAATGWGNNQRTGQATDNQEIQEGLLMTVLHRTVRNGEEITSQGSIMICGNVNPGAKIIAGGSVDIRGNCRGIIHAGAWGDYQAFVVADRLMPQQIRIANLIARSPDEPEKPDYAEKAYIKDGQIIIEPVER